MRTAPESFTKKLESTFHGALRVRWSLKRHCWQIEQRIGRAALAPFRIDEADDSMIRARDGYSLVMSIAEGTNFPCPTCGQDIKLPVREMRDVRCKRCASGKRDESFAGGFFPLDDLFIEHLKMSDPTRFDQLRRVRAETERAEWLQACEHASGQREGAAQYKDALLEQLPKAGFPSLTPHKWHF